MSLDAVIKAVNSILSTVQDVGKVFSYVPFVRSDDVFKALFKNQATSDIRAWTITRSETQSSAQAVHSDQDLHTILIRGYMAVANDKGTETTFQNLVESVRSTFRANRKLTVNAVNNCFECQPISCMVTHGVFAGVLCHYAELRLGERVPNQFLNEVTHGW
jgi:hypothetical protein